MTLELPNQFNFTRRLLRALHGDGNERDARIAQLALSYLETRHREFYLSQPKGEAALYEWGMAHRGDKGHQALLTTSPKALRAVFWKLGLITDSGLKRRVRVPALVAELMDKHLGSDSTQSEFACLACGNPVRVLVGKKGKFTCSICSHRYRLSYNDGRRIAFSRPKRVPEPVMKLTLSPQQQACEILQVSQFASFEEMKTAYRMQLLRNHPDTIRSLGCPTALWAAEEVTKSLNTAWNVIEHCRRQTELEMQTPANNSGPVGYEPCLSVPTLTLTIPPQP